MSKTKIEWASHTVNWLAGCTKVSAACTHCYAESMSARLATMPNKPARYDGVTEGRRWTGVVNYDAEALRRAFDGLRDAKKPRRVFVNSMSDTFHKDAPPESLVDLAEAIRGLDKVRESRLQACRVHGADASQHPTVGHVIMLLTKRPEGLLAWQREHFPDGLPSWVWVGCTVESQAEEDRIRQLTRVRTRGVRYLSCEPMVGPLRIDHWLGDHPGWSGKASTLPGILGSSLRALPDEPPLPGIHWVITGGESGPKARPSHPDWFRSIRDQCAVAGVAYLHKQWGEYGPVDVGHPDGWVCYNEPDKHGDCGPHYGLLDTSRRHEWIARVGKKAAGRLLDGRTHDAFPVTPCP